MNLLMLGRWLPPPRRPVRGMREYHFARHLARTHHLTLGFVTDNPDSAGPISTLRSEFGDLEFATVPRGWKSLASAVRGLAGESCTLSYFRSEALRTRLNERLRKVKYDAIFVSCSGMIPYVLEADRAIPVVADFGKVDSLWWERQAARGRVPGARFFSTEMTRLRLAEVELARRAARCVTESREAAAVVRDMAAEAATVVIPNGIDVDLFGNGPRPGKRPTVVFSTSLGETDDWDDVVGFCSTVVPMLRARVPDIRIVIASRESVSAVRMRALGEVEVMAPVVDMRPLFHTESVAVAPLRAGGDVHGSVLEPMAAGVPVVASASARADLGVLDDRVLPMGAGAMDFALAIVQLLKDPVRRAEVGARARTYIASEHSWEVMARKVEKVLDEATRRQAGRSDAPKPLDIEQLISADRDVPNDTGGR